MTGNYKMIRRFIIVGVLLVFLIVVFPFSFSVVRTGEVGVKVTVGQVDEEPLSEGWHWKVPFFQSVKKINCKQQDVSFDGQVWSETSSRTALYFEDVTVTYTLNSEKAAWIIAHVNNYEKTLLGGEMVSSAVKTSSKLLSDSDATNRAKIEPLVQETLQASVDSKYGDDIIYINKIIIKNVDFEDSYNKAIAEKQNAQLAYEKQAIENQKNVEKAKADAEVAREVAQGEADAAIIASEAKAKMTLLTAEAQAEANRKLEESLTDMVLRNRFYDTWNGQLPKVSGESGFLLDDTFLE